MQEFESEGWRKVFVASALLSSLGLTAYALTYFVILTSSSPTLDFVPTRARTGIDWLVVSQSAYLLIGSTAFLPVGLMYGVERFRERPYASVLASCLALTAMVLIAIGNLPVIAEELYPGPLAGIPAAELLRSQQAEATTCAACDLGAFVAFYAALLIFAQTARAEAPLASRLVTQSLAALALAAGLMPVSPVVSLALVAAAVIALVPVAMMLAISAEGHGIADGQPASVAHRPISLAGAELVDAPDWIARPVDLDRTDAPQPT